MIVIIPDLLNRQELQDIRSKIATLPFVDGKETAGARAQRVKRNEQVSKEASERKEVQAQIVSALRDNATFARELHPRHIRPPLISRYRPGMFYGQHVDDALMGALNARERSDISVTVFLSDAKDYEGGELIIHSSFGPQHVKLPAGAAIAYPSSALHEVSEVTAGERLVAITWAQSYIRDERQREILSDMAFIRDRLSKNVPAAEETDIAFRLYSNLLRMWADS